MKKNHPLIHAKIIEVKKDQSSSPTATASCFKAITFDVGLISSLLIDLVRFIVGRITLDRVLWKYMKPSDVNAMANMIIIM